MTLQLGGDGAITGCTSLENPDLIASGLTTSGSVDAEKVLVASGTAAAPSYTFSGDTDNGLYYAGTNSIGLATAGANAILIDSSNRVGIGTTSPATLLDIRPGATGAQNAITMGYGRAANPTDAVHKIRWASDDLIIEADSANTIASNIQFRNDGNEVMRIDSSGNVGVGATSPVFGAGSGLEVLRSGVATVRVSSNTQAVELRSDAGTGTLEARGSFPLKLGTAGSERMRIDSSGNVGIGTTSATSIGGYTGLSINNATNGGFVDLMSNGSAAFRLLTNGSQCNVESRTAIPIIFFTNTVERMRIDSSGNVGIGTASPQTITGYTVLTLNNSSQGGAIEFKNNNTSYGRLLQGSSAVILETKQNIPLVFGTGTSSTERMRVLPTGGLTFSGDTATANALDDYEEGTWTPTIRENGTGTAWDTLSAQNGSYTKIGDCVMFAGTFNYSAVATNVNAVFYSWLAGFPFASNSSKIAGQFFVSFLYSGVRSVLYSGAFIHGNAYAGIYKDQDNTTPGTMMRAEFPTGAHTVQFQGHYYV